MYIDSFVHPTSVASVEALAELRHTDLRCGLADLADALVAHGAAGALVPLFDPLILDHPPAVEALRTAAAAPVPLHLGVMLDPRAPGVVDRLDLAVDLGVRFLLVAPLQQRLGAVDSDVVSRLTHAAAARGLFLVVGAAFGTTDLYKFDGVAMAAWLANAHPDVPIVVAHGGGLKVLDAFLVADHADNLLLDTSFSLPYWAGSRVEADFAWAMRKGGVHRWVMGSDHPFVPLGEALAAHDRFFAAHGLTPPEVQAILHDNLAGLLA